MVVKSEKKRSKPVVLVIMDGVGAAPHSAGNAVTQAKTPMLSKLWNAFPHGYLEASGPAVGLPNNVRGNSEVGHTNIGAGRVVLQDLPRINKSIENGVFFSNTAFAQAVEHISKHKTKLHILICLSDGRVHSSITHFYAFIDFLKQRKVSQNVYLHAFTDGRDSSPISGANFIKQAISKMNEAKVGKLATIIGRYYSMDRNDQWDRIKLAYDLMTKAEGEKMRLEDVAKTLQKSYSSDETDEFLKPKVIVDETGKPEGVIEDGDAIVCLNYRPDRAIQLTSAFTVPEFKNFDRGIKLNNILYVAMTQYTPDLPILAAFPPDDVAMPLGKIISNAGLSQLRISESEKFPHVTYFFNGGRDLKFEGEERIEVRSPDVATYDMKPEMSAHEVTEIILEKVKLDLYDFILVNYANGDMVGHTGVINAGVKAVETVDFSLRRLVPAVLRKGGELIITADHGNVEEMVNLETGEVDTMHSLFPVPFVHVSDRPKQQQLELGILGDIAPSITNILGLEPDADMTGKNLLPEK
jgi:2,3-bisphosphoglycerate-independent phosphoglycerate mutase